MRARLLAGLVAMGLLVLPHVGASAAADHHATLDADRRTFTWEGSGTGVADPTGFVTEPQIRCTGEPYDCDTVLLHVETVGALTVTLETSDVVARTEPGDFVCEGAMCADLELVDAYLYKSNAVGDVVGRPLTYDCATASPDERCTVPVQPGYYLVEVEYFEAVEAAYVGTAELTPDPTAPPVVEPRTMTLEDCAFTLYYFKDSAARVQPFVPASYRVRPYDAADPQSAIVAAAAYSCGRVEVPGATPAPAVFTVLSAVVYSPTGTTEGPALSDFYVLWVHSDNSDLADLLATHGLPAQHVPGMRFGKPALSLAVHVEVPWSPGPYELSTTGYHQDTFHSHENSFLHVTPDGRPVRMDFVTTHARDHFCFDPFGQDVDCGGIETEADSPVAGFFGGPTRSASNVWDHDPLQRAWFILY